MMRFALLTFLSFAVFAGPLKAQGSPVVVELFTSQGCSSCPPADAILHDLAKRDDVLPLALHVDYWDYIGWKDPFADPAHTKRQKAYASLASRRMIYTPQMVINGGDDLVGADARKLSRMLKKQQAIAPKVALSLSENGAETVLTLRPVDTALQGVFDVQLVRYAPYLRTSIKRGENAGHDYAYANVVRGWQTLGRWDGAAAQEFRFVVEGDLNAAILVQEAGPGAILGAVRVAR